MTQANPYALVGVMTKRYDLGKDGRKELLARLKERLGTNMYKWYPGQIDTQAKMIREEMNIVEASKGLTDSLESQIILEAVKDNSEKEIVVDSEW
jgi:hypothetical protein